MPAGQPWEDDAVKVIATAKFAEACTVTFVDERGSVVATKTVAKGESLSAEQIEAASVKYQVPAGKKLVGWKVNDSNLTPETIINKDVTAKAEVVDGVWVTFDSQGGTSVPSAQVREDGTIDSSAVPVRAGFDFDGWFTAAIGGDKVTADTVFQGSATIYAHWTAHQVNYTVIYWQENANWDNKYLDEVSRDKVQYSYVKSETKSGTAGQQTSVSAGSPDKGFKTARVDNKEIAGDGSTIVNVYYDREVYEVLFLNKTCNHLHIMSVPSESCYEVDRSKTITAKFEANIGSKWPGGFWPVEAGSGTKQGNLLQMPLQGKKFYGPSAAGRATATYYVETLPGDNGSSLVGGKSYKVHHTDRGDGGSVTDEERYDIKGFVCNTQYSNKNGSSFDGAKFYYDRETYHIVFMSQGEKVATADRLFEEEIDGDDTSRYVPTRTGYTFGGWFQDEDCTVPAGEILSGPMPARNLTVYAKWIAPQVQVKVHAEAADGEGTDFSVDAGSVLDEAQLNEKAGITEKIANDPNAFLGWYTKTPNGNWQPFDLSSPVDSDTELYARWRSDTYTITYVINDSDKTLDVQAPVDDSKYADGALAVVKGIPVTATLNNQFANWVDENGNEVAAGSTLEMTRNITLTAVFKPVIEIKLVKMTYDPNEGTGNRYTTDEFAINKLVKADENTFGAPTGYEFDSWNTKKDGSGLKVNAGENVRVNNSGNNILYAQWKPRTDTRYTVKHWFQNVAGEEYSQDASLAADETLAGTTGEQTSAQPKQVEGFNAKAVSQETIAADGSTVVNVYYDRQVYNVTYRYTNEAPAGATELPAAQPYRYGDTFTVAPAATATGYVFSGWSQQGTVTVAGDVEITGSWSAKDQNLTINWVDETGTVLKNAESTTVKYDDEYDVTDQRNASLVGPDGRTYIYDSTTGEVSGTVKRDVEVTFTYSLDEKGGNDPETGEPTQPDGIADKYQATVTYLVINGTFGQGGTTSVTEVITVAKKDENGTVTPVDYRMNVPENMVPAVGYDQQPGTWGNADFNTKLEGGSTYTFTYVYGINNYSVNVSVANGTSNVGTVGTTGTYGSDLAYTFAPADGYALDSVTVDGQPAVLTNGGYTFSALSENHSISVVYAVDANRDGIPDSRQAIVNYNVANGTWADGTAATVTEYVNMYTYRNGEWEPVDPVLNPPAGMVANTGYSQASGAWLVNPAASQLIAGGETTFTYAFTAIPTTVVPTPDPVVPPTVPPVTPPTTPTPATPAGPATVVTAAVPAPAAAPVAPAAPAPEAETIADDATPQAATPRAEAPEQIEDEGTPMGAFDEPHCWVHWVMLIGILLTAVYGIVVVRRRLGLTNEIDDMEKQVLGVEDAETETVAVAGHQAL